MWAGELHPDDATPGVATPGEAHAEWHRNARVPMGTPGCPQDACHYPEDFEPDPAVVNAQRYLTFSDGSEVGQDFREYGIAYVPDAAEPDVWLWESSLGTADRAQALGIVARAGWDAEPAPGGWYGDDRDDSYRLTVRPVPSEPAARAVVEPPF